MLKHIRFITYVCFCTMVAQGAHAQLEQQTGIADPGQVQDRLQEQLTIPRLSPKVQVKQLELIGAPEGAENINLVLNSVTVEGASVFSPEELSEVYKDDLGQDITLADVYRIANQITLKYRNAGYVLTRAVVPPQTIEGGAIRYQVVEGFISNINIQAPDGESNNAISLIRKYASNIGTNGPVNVRELERALLLIDDLPGVNARSILSPSETTPGGADLLIIVERDLWDVLLSADNFGSRYLGPVQLGGAVTYRSLLGLNDSWTAQFVLAPDEGVELAFGALKYEQPIGPYGTKFSLSASKTDTNPGYNLAQFEVRGASELYEAKITHPFIRSRNENLNAHIAFDMRNIDSSNNLTATRKDRIRAVRAGATYEFLDRVFSVALNTVGIEISRGVNVFGASEEGDQNLTRTSGDPQFTKAEVNVQRLQRLNNDFNLLVKGSGQLSNNPLLSSEEFSVGGVNSVRGYDPSEITGDDGVSGTLELQWNNPGDLQKGYLEKYQLYTFLDAGTVWDQDATTSNAKRESLAGAGAGVRANFSGNFSAGMGVAFPLNVDVQTQGDDDPKLYMNLSKQF